MPVATIKVVGFVAVLCGQIPPTDELPVLYYYLEPCDKVPHDILAWVGYTSREIYQVSLARVGERLSKTRILFPFAQDGGVFRGPSNRTAPVVSTE